MTNKISVLNMIKKFLKDDKGATSIEYAIIGSLLSVVIVGTMPSLSATVKGLFTAIAEQL